MTRTRLRPGGPLTSPVSSTSVVLAAPPAATARPTYYSGDPQAVYGTPVLAPGGRMRNGGNATLAHQRIMNNSYEMDEFRRPGGMSNRQEQFPSFYGTMAAGSATPLVKHRVNHPLVSDPDQDDAVQMFRTRVVYADVKDAVQGRKSQEASV